jgi:mRNA interferase MazF
MGVFVRGDVVIVPFPFSSQAAGKVRPALVLATPVSGELILCQITSTQRGDGYSLPINVSDFISGGLRHDSFVRVSSLFTYEGDIARSRVGQRIIGCKVPRVRLPPPAPA